MDSKFGLGQITSVTPMWATWVFRTVFAVVTVAIFIVAADPAITDAEKVRIGVYLKGGETLVYLLSKMFGVKVKDDEK